MNFMFIYIKSGLDIFLLLIPDDGPLRAKHVVCLKFKNYCVVIAFYILPSDLQSSGILRSVCW